MFLRRLFLILRKGFGKVFSRAKPKEAKRPWEKRFGSILTGLNSSQRREQFKAIDALENFLKRHKIERYPEVYNNAFEICLHMAITGSGRVRIKSLILMAQLVSKIDKRVSALRRKGTKVKPSVTRVKLAEKAIEKASKSSDFKVRKAADVATYYLNRARDLEREKK